MKTKLLLVFLGLAFMSQASAFWIEYHDAQFQVGFSTGANLSSKSSFFEDVQLDMSTRKTFVDRSITGVLSLKNPTTSDNLGFDILNSGLMDSRFFTVWLKWKPPLATSTRVHEKQDGDITSFNISNDDFYPMTLDIPGAGVSLSATETDSGGIQLQFNATEKKITVSGVRNGIYGPLFWDPNRNCTFTGITSITIDVKNKTNFFSGTNNSFSEGAIDCNYQDHIYSHAFYQTRYNIGNIPVDSNLSQEWVIHGYPDALFYPERAITRAEFLKIAMNRFGEKADESGQEFKDTTGWQIGYTNAAKRVGYVNWQNGLFRPNDPITSSEAIKILAKVSHSRAPSYAFSKNNVVKRWEACVFINDTYQGENMELDKPVIYLYPTTTQDTHLTEEVKNWYFTFTYPDYGTGWHVLAKPDGTLTDYASKIEVPYLFWEGTNLLNQEMKEGFYVEKSNVVSFLQKKLDILGLNSREKTDFITYWAPILMRSGAVTVKFIVWDDYSRQVAELHVNPAPESIQRILMVFRPARDWDKYIKEQKLERFVRKGYTLIEWWWSNIGEEK